MSYGPPPPPPMKRPFPRDWNSHPRPPKEPRAPGTDMSGFFTGAGSEYSGYGFYGGWGNPDYTQNYQNNNFQNNNNNSNVDFTDDYSAFYGKESQNGGQRGRGNQRGRGRSSGNQGNMNRGPGNQNRGYGNPRNRGGQRGDFRGRGRGGQRGMPPNMFNNGRGRGRGGKNSANVPPVHTLAKTQPEFPDVKNMSVAEKLHRYCLFLRSDESIKINPIQTIMNAITGSKLGMKYEYDSEELARVSGKAMYTGVLKLESVFLARAIRPNKKELKQEVFQKAFNVMLGSTVAEIYNLVDPGADAIREELDRQMKAEEESTKNEFEATDASCAEAKCLVGGDIPSILAQLASTIQNMKSIPESPISILEQASTQAHVLIKHEYQVDITRLVNGRLYCKGKLSIGPIVIGRGGGTTKKLCKTETYEKTLERLKTKTPAELMESVPEEPEPDFGSERWQPNKAKQNLSIEERFGELIRCLGTMSFKESNINQIDISAMQNGLTPMLIYKPDPKKGEQCRDFICELYLEKVLITTIEGTTRRDCMLKAYSSAWEVLTSTSVDTLVTQHKRITDEEVKDPALLDVIIKGSGRTVESNMAGLRRFGYKISELEEHNIDDLVIMEHNNWSKDRTRNAFCILQFSCNQYGMILQWETESVKSNFRCVISIQRQQLGESYGTNKNHARNLAATDALFKLYETHNVIKICPRIDDEMNWIPWDTITAASDKLRNGSTVEEPSVKNDEYGNPLPDSFIMTILKGKLDEFIKNSNKDELIIGPGIGLTEGREVRSYARSFKLKCDTMQHQGEPYMLIYEKLGWQELVKVLMGRSRPYGKFVLVDKDELPKHEDILDNIVKEIPKAVDEPIKAAEDKVKKEI